MKKAQPAKKTTKTPAKEVEEEIVPENPAPKVEDEDAVMGNEVK